MSRPYSNWEGLPETWTPRVGVSVIEDILLEDTPGTLTEIAEVGTALTSLLLYKNMRYGDSALSPVSVFAPGLTARDRLAVRMDDKINRIAKGMGLDGGDREHPGIDLAGYLLLDVIAQWRQHNVD